MPLLIPREKEYWQRKPTERRDINYSNQFADSLVACVVTDEVDLVSGIKYANRVDYGEYIHFNDVGYNEALDTQAGTIVADFWEESILADWKKIGYGYDYSSADRQIVSLSKRGDPYARYLMGTNNVGGGYTPDPIISQEKGIICLSYNSNDPTAAALRYHRNSILEASVAWKGLPLSLDSRKRILVQNSHAVKFFYMLNRPLDDDEAKCLSDAPYQVLIKKKTIFLLPASPPTPTPTPASSGVSIPRKKGFWLVTGDHIMSRVYIRFTNTVIAQASSAIAANTMSAGAKTEFNTQARGELNGCEEALVEIDVTSGPSSAASCQIFVEQLQQDGSGYTVPQLAGSVDIPTGTGKYQALIGLTGYRGNVILKAVDYGFTASATMQGRFLSGS